MLGFLESPITFFYGARSWLLHCECSEFSLMSSKKSTTRRIKNSQHVYCLQTVLKLARWQMVAEIGFCGTWDLQKRKRSIGNTALVLWNTTMKNWFRHHLENFISFPLIHRFAGIRRVLTELEADNWKHRSNYTVTLRLAYFYMSPSLLFIQSLTLQRD